MRPKVKYAVIHRHQDEYPISIMCKFFGVSRSGYYDFVKRLGQREHDADLAAKIQECQDKADKTYGYRRVWKWLKDRKIERNPKTVLRVMKKYGLLSEIRRRRKWVNLGQQMHKYENLLQRQFRADRPNAKWVTDISYIHTKEGVLYLSMIRDLYDNSIVAYKTATQQTVNLVLDTIRLAMKKEKVKTTGLAGGLHRPYKGLIQPRLKTRERFANRNFITGCPLPGAAFYLPLTTGSPVNGSLNSLMLI